MYSPKQKVSSDDQSDIDNQSNATHSDVDSPNRSYALIETNPNEFDHIIDLLRQFFPNTKIVECNNQNHSSHGTTQQTPIESNNNLCVPISSVESDSNNEQLSSNTNCQTFKGKVKDYLQRRYLEQISEHQSRKEMFTKYHSHDSHSFGISTLDKSAMTSKGRSLDSASDAHIQRDHLHIERSENKRGILQRCATIDVEDDEQISSSDDMEKKTFGINRFDGGKEIDQKRILRYSYSGQQTAHNNNPFLLSYDHSFEQDQDKRTLPFTSEISVPYTPYSASSDPGPYHSLWLKPLPTTPHNLFNFRFPQSEEQLIANAQGSIAQLSTLTKILCNDTSVFASISPRFKTETHESNTTKESSSVPPCQICQEQFDSHQTYLVHYRTHLENSYEDDILDSETNCDRLNDLRNYLCKICSKRFSRSDMLNRHLRLHSGIRPYRCPMCNTYFSRSDHLATHLRIHTGEKPYTCPYCSYTACRRDMIIRHSRIHTKHKSQRKNATSSFASSNES